MRLPDHASSKHWFVIAGFFVALWVPIVKHPTRYLRCLYTVAPDGLTLNRPAEIEKRFLIGFPRQTLLVAHDRLRFSAFGATPRSVIQGRDGWLYYRSEVANDGDTMDDFRGLSLPDAATIPRWWSLLENRASWCAANQAAYLFAVAPNKQSLYPEFLPAFYRRRPNSPPTRLDLLAKASRGMRSVDFIDLREPLLQAKEREMVYYRTDSHWNDAGAFAADTAIVTKLQGTFPLLQPLAREDFRQRVVDMSGDISLMANLAGQLDESPQRFVPLRDLPARMPDGQRLLSSDLLPYHPTPVLERGNYVMVSECPTAPDLRVVVFHDSFGRSLMPFLAQHFRHVTFIRQLFDASIVAALRPQIVIDMVVERHLELAFDVAPLPSVSSP